MTRAEWEALVEYTLNIGRQMMECGADAADINRVMFDYTTKPPATIEFE